MSTPPRKGSVPLNPLAAGPRQQPEMPPVQMMPQIPAATAFGKKAGPLGLRGLKPEAASRIMRLREELAAAGATGPISVTAPSLGESPRPVTPEDMAALAFGAATEEQPQDKPAGVPVTPELPTPPGPMAFGIPEPPKPKEEPKKEEEKPLTQEQMMRTPMHAIAESGAESRVYKNLRYDPEFADVVLWKASPDRRKNFTDKHVGEIDWSSLLTNFDIRQDVLIWTKPQEIRATFRTMTADDEVSLRRILSDEYARTDADYEVGTVITTVAAGLVSIMNNKLPPLPAVMQSGPDAKSRLDIMKERLKFVLRLPYPLLQDLAINYAWFIMRVQEAQRAGELGNG